MVQEELSIQFYQPGQKNKKCQRVRGTDDLPVLIEEMTHLMKERNGVGLAAPQVGLDLQLAIVQLPTGKTHVLINPEIVNLGGKDVLGTESCLSLPPVERATARVWRSEIAQVRSGTLENPEAAQLTVYKGAAARIVQHEIDHLDGIFFIDRCQGIGRQIVLNAYKRFMRESLTHD